MTKLAADLDLRTTVCVRCGNRGRLVVTDGALVTSRCYVCGDESRRRVRAAATLLEPRIQRTA